MKKIYKIFYFIFTTLFIMQKGISSDTTLNSSNKQLTTGEIVGDFLDKTYKSNDSFSATLTKKELYDALHEVTCLAYQEDRTLYWMKAKINTIPSEIGNLKYLVFINLSSNYLKTIPPEVSSLKFLEILDLSNNQFEKIPSQIIGIERLKSLNLFDNQLGHIPQEIWHHNTLADLNVSRNRITTIRLSTPPLQQSLLTLNLCENPFPPYEIKWAKHHAVEINDFISYYHLKDVLFQKYVIFIKFIDNDLLPINLDIAHYINTYLWCLYFKKEGSNHNCHFLVQ